MSVRIGLIGLGKIGSGLATNILKKHGQLSLWNRTRAKAEAFVEQGAEIKESPADVARSSDVIIVCVSDTPDVDNVVFGKDGAAEGFGEGKLLLDLSTISAVATEEFAARAAARGTTWLDCPVSGGDVGARNGTLSIMVGGNEESFQRALPVLQLVGAKIVLMGGIGAGQRTKLANQIAVVGTIASMGEALAFAQKSGLDVAKVLDVVAAGAAGSWSLSNYGPRVLRGDLNPGFSASLMAKDLRLVEEAIQSVGGEFAMTRLMAALYERMVANGDGGLGNHGAVKYLGWEAKPPE